MTKLLTIDELSDQISVPRQTLYKWIRTNRIPYIKMPNRKVRFDVKKVEAWLNNKSNIPTNAGQVL